MPETSPVVYRLQLIKKLLRVHMIQCFGQSARYLFFNSRLHAASRVLSGNRPQIMAMFILFN
jgi:hypothetical protein